MRRVEKNPVEPPCLEVLRATPGANWSSVHADQKLELRKATWRDQLGLCVYCCQSLPDPEISTASHAIRIEHWTPRHTLGGSGDFDWPILFAACRGDNDDASRERQDRYHCDNYRGQLSRTRQTLVVHPCTLHSDVSSAFSFDGAGTMTSSLYQNDIDQVLNLNIWNIKLLRKGIVDELLDVDDRQTLAERLAFATLAGPDGCLPGFAPVLEYWARQLLGHLAAIGPGGI